MGQSRSDLVMAVPGKKGRDWSALRRGGGEGRKGSGGLPLGKKGRLMSI